ncbi:MAG: EamA family transporter [Actinomycetota bacterium]
MSRPSGALAAGRRPPAAGLGLAAIAGAAALWAVAAAVASDLFDAGVPPVELAAARSVIAALGLGAIALARRRTGGPRTGSGAVGLPHLIALGLSIALVNAAYYLAIDRLAVAVAIVLQYTAPALVVTYTALSARRAPSLEILAAVAAAVAGVVLVAEVFGGDLGTLDGLGIVFGLCSAVLFATYTLLSEPAGTAWGPIDAMFRAFVVAAIAWVLFQIPRGMPDELLDPANIPRVVFVGLFGTLAPFLLYVWAIQVVRPERATIAATLEPVLAAIIAWVWLGQELSAMQISGGLLVIAAVALLQLRRKRPLVAPEP